MGSLLGCDNMKKYKKIKHGDGWTIIYHGDDTLPLDIHYSSETDCIKMCNFLNREHEHGMKMKELLVSSQKTEDYTKLMYNELLEILLTESKEYRKHGKLHHPTINGFHSIKTIAPQVLKWLAIDLGLADRWDIEDQWHDEVDWL